MTAAVANTAGSAAAAGLVACDLCGAVHRRDDPQAVRCGRCGSVVKARKPGSLSRTWALLLAAIILYIPANVMPVMQTSSLFGKQSDTIISGVIYFWNSGSMGLAALIFGVSILVPMMKMGGLAYLAFSVQRKRAVNRRQCARLYRLVEFVGRWSMLDVYVVALMVGLVRFKTLTVIDAGPGALAFGSVVVLTMLASHSFDPRLIWDDCRDA